MKGIFRNRASGFVWATAFMAACGTLNAQPVYRVEVGALSSGFVNSCDPGNLGIQTASVPVAVTDIPVCFYICGADGYGSARAGRGIVAVNTRGQYRDWCPIQGPPRARAYVTGLVTISGPPGATVVSTTMNLDFAGEVTGSNYDWIFRAGLAVGGGTGGGFTGEINAGTPPSGFFTNGVFAQMTTPALTFGVGYPTPLTINVFAESTGPILTTVDYEMSLRSSDYGGVVFNLPPGYTANSEDFGIVDNRWVPDFDCRLNDQTAPTITGLPAELSLTTDENCQALIPALTADAVVDDNCSGDVQVTQDPPAGTIVSAGIIPLTVTATDAAGNSGSHTVIVVVNDLTPPSIALHGPHTLWVECGTGSFEDPGAIATDSCDPAVAVVVGGDVVNLGASGAYIVTYDAVDNSGNPAMTVIRIVNVTEATPTADAGHDQSIPENSVVALDGSATTNIACGAPTYDWIQVAGDPVALDLTDPIRPTFTAPLVPIGGGTLTFQLIVTNGTRVSEPDFVNITITNVNHAPDAIAGDDQTVAELSLVTLNGSGSFDPDGDLILYSWEQLSGEPVTLADDDGPTPSFVAPTVPEGGATLLFDLLVSDGYGGTATDQVAVTVQDSESPPVCEHAKPSVDYLWPPNHKLIRVSIEGVRDSLEALDDHDDSEHPRRQKYRSRSRGHCGRGQVTISILSVTQDEPINGLGDGDTGPDAVVQGETVLLRAERSGVGNGRVYRITFRAEDEAGVSCVGEVTVCVPHDNRKGACRRGHGNSPDPQCADDGQFYNSLGQ